MIRAIYDIGAYILNDKSISLEDDKQVTDILCEDPKSSEHYKTILTVSLIRNGNDVTFNRVGIDDYSQTHICRYLYRRGGSNGPDFSPTCRITEPKKTFEGKFLKWFDIDFSDPSMGLTDEEQMILLNIKKSIISNREKIFEEIIERYDSLKTKRESGILTVCLYDNDERKYPGDILFFRKILRSMALKNYFFKFNTSSKSENQVCTVCREKRDEVYGFVSTYNFYTVDKPGMVSGGFDQSNAWKNYPVCRNCALTLEEGKKFIALNSDFRFYGFNYLLIPHLLTPDAGMDVYETLKYYRSKGAKIQLTKKYKRLLDETENDILGALSGKSNTFQCNILIYAASNNEFKILSYIEGIFPSRLRELFKVKESIDKNQYFKEFNVPIYSQGKRTGEQPLEFNFGAFWFFFGKRKDEDLSSYFLDIISKVFRNEKISYHFFLNGIVNRIRKQFAAGYSTKEAGLRGLCSLLYLRELGVLGDYYHGDDMNENKIRNIASNPQHKNSTEKLEAIFAEFPDFFYKNSTRAVFTLGSLAQLLLDVQYAERSATPFRTKLQGLRLDQRKVTALLPEIQNKFDEYNKSYYRELEKLASEYLIQAGENWGLSKDEVSFYFVLGMNLASYLKAHKEVKNNE